MRDNFQVFLERARPSFLTHSSSCFSFIIRGTFHSFIFWFYFCNTSRLLKLKTIKFKTLKSSFEKLGYIGNFHSFPNQTIERFRTSFVVWENNCLKGSPLLSGCHCSAKWTAILSIRSISQLWFSYPVDTMFLKV